MEKKMSSCTNFTEKIFNVFISTIYNTLRTKISKFPLNYLVTSFEKTSCIYSLRNRETRNKVSSKLSNHKEELAKRKLKQEKLNEIETVCIETMCKNIDIVSERGYLIERKKDETLLEQSTFFKYQKTSSLICFGLIVTSFLIFTL